MLKLFQIPPTTWDIRNTSPACLKLETWLRLTQIPYEVAPWPPTVPPPKGKWPYVDDDGAVLGDSTLIIEHLMRTRGVDPDAKLSKVERAVGLAFRRMMKENLYWLVTQIRYREPANWELYRPVMAQPISALMGGDAEKTAGFLEDLRKTVMEQMIGHGIGRHSDAEIYQIGTADLMAISDFLGDKPFFFGAEPTSVDATAYAYVASIINVPLDSPITRAGKERKNLVNYCERMRERFFSDLPRR